MSARWTLSASLVLTLGCGRLESAADPDATTSQPADAATGGVDGFGGDSSLDVVATDAALPFDAAPYWPDGSAHAQALWARQTHVPEKGRFIEWSLAVGADGRVALAGGVPAGIDLGGGPDPCMGCFGIVVRNPDGSLAWQHTYHGGAKPLVMSFAGDGALYVGGQVVGFGVSVEAREEAAVVRTRSS